MHETSAGFDPYGSLEQQRDALRSGTLTCRELTEHCLERILKLDDTINAFRVVDADGARAQADAAQGRLDAGDDAPLLGIPVGIKDDIDVAGMSTQYGSRWRAGPCADDSEIVRRLRDAGAVIVGKTNMSELALLPMCETVAQGVTRNPWNLDFGPGGSSGGSAAAVAAGLVSAAIGGDGGGSIRGPAAFCGVFALKAQRGRLSLMPDAERWHGLLQLGPITRTVRDSAIIYDAISGNVPGDADQLPKAAPLMPQLDEPDGRRLRVATSVRPPLPVPVAAEVRDPVAQAARTLREQGHDVARGDPPYGIGALAATPRFAHGTWEAGKVLPSLGLAERRTRHAVWAGRAVPGPVLRWSRRLEQATAAAMRDFFREFDVLLTPVTATGPLRVGEWQGWGMARSFVAEAHHCAFTPAWNFTGQPAAVVPLCLSRDGVPLGVQVVGPAGGEALVLSVAAALEAGRGWAARPPGE